MLIAMRWVDAAWLGTLCLTTALWTARSTAQPPPVEQDAADGGDAEEEAPSDEDGPAGATPGASEPAATRACLSAFSDAQKHRREGRLLQARSELITCSQATCPDEIVARCTPWLREVTSAVPTIIPVARDGRGRDLVRVRVLIDGVLVTERLDGMPLEVDPGAHEVVLEPEGEPPMTLDVVVVQAQKNRMVVAELRPPLPFPTGDEPPPKPEPKPSSSVSPWAWVGFGVGGAGLLAGTITGALALARANDLEAACNGTTCSNTFNDDYDAGVRLAHTSTAMFVIGGVGVALGVAALIWLGDDPKAPVLELGPGRAGVRVRF